MEMHFKNAGAWGLCWIVVAIIASIPTLLEAGPGARLLIRSGDDCGTSFLNLTASGTADPEVRTYVERYLTQGRYETELILGRAEAYFPGIES